MLVDLNVEWPQKSFKESIKPEDLERLRATLSTLYTLGYTHTALNFTVNHSDKFPNNVKDMNPMNIQELFGDFMKETGMKIYSRITLVIDDPSNGQSLSKISQAFDIIAALPISERGLTLATTNLEIDLLTFNYGQRLPTFLKHKSICSCVNRGVKVEVVYSHALRDIQSRRQYVQNVRSVIRSSRSRGIVISSGAQNSLECRNILGVSSLIKLLGLESDKCTKAMGQLASLVLLNGRLRNKSYKQTVAIGGGDSDVVNDLEGIDDNKNIKIVKRSLSPAEDKSGKKRKL
ncbi:RNA-binding RNA processing protein RPP1 NDAI_0C02050 [Naumovozyma dairenensis CBS 421]|uniref:Uncharacterized protein n=1 Tax=Naumovozyma dairenensis (strain ATCC 10597 / BCRC 20456 / CBS 421 / NBRC 0211 / NRRL Y-12639) TaxID=1071378 RepID=G0W7V4_NAUDC|nr:hypothetical protein NDAI_0C02050 [Naumovozyma dairenensis CBS 421]CCD23865.1 hypothetical protein NDAI_0C02050 [Naumovozyma dairenensis CBS 421]